MGKCGSSPFFFSSENNLVRCESVCIAQLNEWVCFVVGFKITFQVKRVRKAKVDGSESVAISDDSQSGESLPGGHSVLEISGPTIPSPGPSGS